VEADDQRWPLAIWVWPLILAQSVLRWLLDLYSFLRGPHSAPHWLAPGHPTYLLTLGLMIAVFTFLEGRSLRQAASGNPETNGDTTAVPVAIVAAVPIAIAVAAEIIRRHFGAPLLFGGQYVTIITIVALSILGALGLSAQARTYFTRAT
jgi:preprotein translocase subunit SecY